MWYINNSSIRRFSDFQAKMFKNTSANMISVYRIFMALFIPPIFAMGLNILGITIFAIAVYLDFIDGAVARYQQDTDNVFTSSEIESSLGFFARLRLKGCTETGKWLDPFADKFLIQVTLFTLGWNVFPNSFLFISLGLAITLTIVRPFKNWMMKKGWRKSADGRANIFGKVKMWLEVMTIIALFNVSETVLENILTMILKDVLMGLVIGSAFFSLIFHLMPSRKNK